MDFSLPGSSLRGILQERVLEWVAISPGDLPDPGIKPGSPALQADTLTSEPPGKWNANQNYNEKRFYTRQDDYNQMMENNKQEWACGNNPSKMTVASRKWYSHLGKQCSISTPNLIPELSNALAIFPGGSNGKASAYYAGRPRFNPWVRKVSWRRKWQPTLVFLPGKSYGWRSLVGYSP